MEILLGLIRLLYSTSQLQNVDYTATNSSAEGQRDAREIIKGCHDKGDRSTGCSDTHDQQGRAAKQSEIIASCHVCASLNGVKSILRAQRQQPAACSPPHSASDLGLGRW
ncbi:hypothetical protein F4679DRAFT_146331 [Xylaria curta]|nr:hypothetical protein F4679DRAFT_146331 [Xylaria curta]